MLLRHKSNSGYLLNIVKVYLIVTCFKQNVYLFIVKSLKYVNSYWCRDQDILCHFFLICHIIILVLKLVISIFRIVSRSFNNPRGG